MLSKEVFQVNVLGLHEHRLPKKMDLVESCAADTPR